MNNLTDFTHIFGLNRPVVAIDSSNAPDYTLTLDNGVTITVNHPKPERQVVAYFGYPDREVPEYFTSRKVIVLKSDARYVSGLDTDDNNQYKTFLRSRMVAYRAQVENVE